MRIAIFSEVYWPMVSGVSLVLQRLVAALQARGHVVRVYTAAYSLPDGQADHPHVYRAPSKRLFLYPDVQWGFPDWAAIRDDFAAFHPDVVHLATEFAMGGVGLRLARAHEVPIVASAHTDYERYAGRYHLEWLMPAGWSYLRWFYGHATRVLCPSYQYERHLQLRGVRHTGIWSRGIDREIFSPAHRSEEIRAGFGVAPDQQMVLYVGRLAAEKNLHLLLEGWPQIHARHPQARLVVVGTGPLEDGLRANTPDGVTVAGVRTRSRALGHLRLCRLLRLSVEHRDVRQRVARGDGIRPAVARGARWRCA
jgi:phosphatidylinositol alpha 1,6-mannosyltransferase